MPEGGDRSPRFLAWWIAAISFALPWIGVAMILLGIRQTIRGEPYGWLIYAGAAAVLIDIAIDLWWADPAISQSDEPELNVPGGQLKGRRAIVVEAFENGRGKIRVGDTVWPAEGPNLPAGASVIISGCRGPVLTVTPH